MKDNPTRLRVVGGTEFVEPEPALVPAKPKTPRRKRPSMTGQLVMHKCAKCSDELGYEYHQMVQVLRRPVEANGKLVDGGLWWACARCLTPYYLIRMWSAKR